MNAYVGLRLISRASGDQWQIADIRLCPESGREHAALRREDGHRVLRESCPVGFLWDFYEPAPVGYCEAVCFH